MVGLMRLSHWLVVGQATPVEVDRKRFKKTEEINGEEVEGREEPISSGSSDPS